MLIEKLGEGWDKIICAVKEHPYMSRMPQIMDTGNTVIVTLFAGDLETFAHTSVGLGENVPLTGRQKTILGMIAGERANIKLLAQMLQVARKTITRDTDYLVKSNLIKRAGSKKAGYYILKSPDKNEEDNRLNEN